MTDTTPSAARAAWPLGRDAAGWAVGACLVASAALLMWKARLFFHDDAFISLRYARHLAELGDLAWNPGERVEGYTNLLHILVSSLLIRLGADPMDAARAINFVSVAVLVAAGWRLTGLATRDVALRLGALLPALSLPVIAWAYGGLEACMAAALIALALLCVAPVWAGRAGIGACLAASCFFALAYLTRPDAVVANFAAGVAVLAVAPGPLAVRLRMFVAVGLVSALVLAGHLAFRQAWYGEWLPLTFHAKVGIEMGQRLLNGGEYAGRAMLLLPGLIAVLALAVATRGARLGAAAWPARLARGALIMAGFQAGYIIWSGGDHMDHARIFVPVIPALILALAGFLAAEPARIGRAVALLLAVAALVQALVLRPLEADPAASYGAFMGLRLAEHFPEPVTIAVATAGSTPYFADHHIYIDTLGLNDPVIAKRDPVPQRTIIQNYPGHGKGDGAYVLERAPDVIVFGTAVGNPPDEPVFLTDYELADAEEFHRCYALRRFPAVVPEDFPLTRPDMSVTPDYMYMERVCE